MNTVLRRYWPVLIVTFILVATILFTLRPYGWNMSALFHLDTVIAGPHPVPSGFVVLQVPGYDGAQYYQVARSIPKIMDPSQWKFLRSHSPGSYAYQRFLLPMAVWVLSLGQESALPFVFLAINVLSLLGTCILLLRWRRDSSLYALCLCLSPAATIALHFQLAEPLTILLVTAMMLRFLQTNRLDALQLLLLSLLVLSREVNILFVLALGILLVLKWRLREAVSLLIPLGVFLLLHGLIYAIFGQMPFLWSAGKQALPLKAIAELLSGQRGYNVYTLSSIALFLLFVVPSLVIVARQMLQNRKLDAVTALLGFFLLVMLVMPGHIWGSITSIGRVITPVYPLFALHGIIHNTRLHQLTAVAVILIGLAAAVGLALIVHPHILTN